jgi:hypothetical protein
MNLADDELLKQYREKQEEIKRDKENVSNMRNEIQRLEEKVYESEKERNVMRRMITRMIEENIDSVQVRLQGDNILQQDLWYDAPPSNAQSGAMQAGQPTLYPNPNIVYQTPNIIYQTTAAVAQPTSIWTTITKYLGIL